ncbi:hypothetical protein DOTSEDRAFT_50806 [Dothistroma septosporum NZE10]|uniref:ASST-domain-containing protein n=1 Tax=Dothistroma septosporum (strain NZE10 / CBS 128990) TaxID=675120 RepID=N1PYB9_DOTSN|nr:hypothetical protein DOTSEDRAFT_50806 [Dothistroma septosporum NZE10]
MRSLDSCCALAATFVSFAVHATAQTATTPRNPTWPYQNFTTEPSLQPPVLEISKNESQCKLSPGYLLFSPAGNSMWQKAPLIMTDEGELVWNGPKYFNGFNFGVQKYKGEAVLVGWNGTTFREPVGRGQGSVYIWDRHYQLMFNVTLNDTNLKEIAPFSDGVSTTFLNNNGTFYDSEVDLHDHYITEEGTIVVLGNNVTQRDLRSVQNEAGEPGPKDGWVVDAQVYEIDIETNKVIFAWRSLDHLDQLPFSASVYPLGSEGFDGTSQNRSWGYFHPNAVVPFTPYQGSREKGYIISSRYLSSGIAVDHAGQVLWRVRGWDSSMDRPLEQHTLDTASIEASFRYQHDIRVVSGTEQYDTKGSLSSVDLRFFDNHNNPIDSNKTASSGKTVALDFKAMTYSLKERSESPSRPVFATAQGSHARLPNANAFNGYGWVPVMQEFSPNGDLLATIQFGATPKNATTFFSSQPSSVTLSYRAFKQQWRGCPTQRPSVVIQDTVQGQAGHGSTIFISWNGATEVEAWEVYGGIASEHFIQKVEKKGFETVAKLQEPAEFVRVKPVLRKGSLEFCGQSEEEVESDKVFVHRTPPSGA